MIDWIVDFEAMSHIAPKRSYFQSYHLISLKNFTLGYDMVFETIGRGSIVVDTNEGSCDDNYNQLCSSSF